MIGTILSVRQPWAYLLVAGVKDVENRKLSTKVRGHVFIHAGKTFDMEGYRFIKENYPDVKLPSCEEFTTEMMGGIVGGIFITDCVRECSSRWFFGPWGYLSDTDKAWSMMYTIPLKGKLGFFRKDIPLHIGVDESSGKDETRVFCVETFQDGSAGIVGLNSACQGLKK